jgi:hypothetical protein
LGTSLVVAVLLGEAVVRLVRPQQLIVPNPEIWRPAEIVGWRHRENANTVINTGEGLVHFVTDSLGYRVNYVDSVPPPDDTVASLLFIGDSFIEAVQVENRFTLPQVIGRALAEQGGIGVRADNDAVGGWNPNHYLLESRIALEKRRYDLGLVFLYTSNDVVSGRQDSFAPEQISQRHRLRLPRSFHWKEWIRAVFYPINDFFETRSHLFIFFKTTMKTTLARLGLSASYFPVTYLIRSRNSQAWMTTAAICRDIDSVFEAHDVPVLFVLLPAVYQVNEEIFYEHVTAFNIDIDSVDLEQPNKLLAQAFAANSLELIDPLPYIRERSADGFSLYGSVDRHFSARGHQATGEYLLPIIRERLLDRWGDNQDE